MQLISFLILGLTYAAASAALSATGLSATGLEGPVYAIGPLAVSLLSSGAGILANRMFNKDPEAPEVPDFVSPVENTYAEAESRLRTRADRQANRARASAAAQGLGASGQVALMNPILQNNADMMTRLSAKRADAINQAENREEQAEFQIEQNQYQQDLRKQASRATGISSVVNSIGQYGINAAFSDDIVGEDGEEVSTWEKIWKQGILGKNLGGGQSGGGATTSAGGETFTGNPLMDQLYYNPEIQYKVPGRGELSRYYSQGLQGF